MEILIYRGNATAVAILTYISNQNLHHQLWIGYSQEEIMRISILLNHSVLCHIDILMSRAVYPDCNLVGMLRSRSESWRLLFVHAGMLINLAYYKGDIWKS